MDGIICSFSDVRRLLLALREWNREQSEETRGALQAADHRRRLQHPCCHVCAKAKE